ncbi:MAG: CPBP family intramembrane metalloprotease [Anaerolineae bacterium]|nr:CPBP family intramembrane metalloprotease [Anaerolineae bacterium]NUQ02743.1 CPBP family intramembrane metalloprotease [Anaerolineae bacterium]
MDILGSAAAVGTVGVVIFAAYRANRVLAAGRRRDRLLTRLLTFVTLASLLYAGVVVAAAVSELDGSVLDAVALIAYGAAAAVCFVGGCVLLRSKAAARRLKLILPSDAGFLPDSPVHITAVVLILAYTSVIFGDFVAAGGISGLADSISNTGVTLGGELVALTLWLVATIVGVGLGLRRTFRMAIVRLGLRLPILSDLANGAGVGFLMVMFALIFTATWMGLVSPEQFQAQTEASARLAESFGSLSAIIVLNLLIALGEEVFFRGALLPIFGNLPTSIFFVILHTQYTLTPAALQILIVSLTFGWLRKSQNTTAALIAHFVYNGVLLSLGLLQVRA